MTYENYLRLEWTDFVHLMQAKNYLNFSVNIEMNTKNTAKRKLCQKFLQPFKISMNQIILSVVFNI